MKPSMYVREHLSTKQRFQQFSWQETVFWKKSVMPTTSAFQCLNTVLKKKFESHDLSKIIFILWSGDQETFYYGQS